MLIEPNIIDISEQNLHEVLQMSAENALVLCFYSQSQPESTDFVALLERLNQRYENQFILAKVDCDNEKMVAAQFQIHAVPTTYLFKEGSPVDAFQGALPEEQVITKLVSILPKEEELKFNQALGFLEVEDFDSALPLLRDGWELSEKKNTEIGLLYAETYIALKKTEPAKAILDTIPIQDRDNRWQGLQAQIELLLKAADTPEIQQLQADFDKHPDSIEIALKLSVQLHQANRNEEALQLLFNILKNDLGADNGNVKQAFLSTLSAIGDNDPITNKYRRLMYSLLY